MGFVSYIDNELAQGKKIGDKLEVDGIQARFIGDDIEIVSPLGKELYTLTENGNLKILR